MPVEVTVGCRRTCHASLQLASSRLALPAGSAEPGWSKEQQRQHGWEEGPRGQRPEQVSAQMWGDRGAVEGGGRGGPEAPSTSHISVKSCMHSWGTGGPQRKDSLGRGQLQTSPGLALGLGSSKDGLSPAFRAAQAHGWPGRPRACPWSVGSRKTSRRKCAGCGRWIGGEGASWRGSTVGTDAGV